jgi:hypothetical protein
VLTVFSIPQEQSIREEILSGLLADKGGAEQISTAMRNQSSVFWNYGVAC